MTISLFRLTGKNSPHYCLFFRWIHHRWLVDSPHKEPVICKVFSCHNFTIFILDLRPLLLTISIKSQMWWRIHLTFIHWLLQNFAHGTTAVLLWHVQNCVVIWIPEIELQLNEFSPPKMNYDGKIISKIGPRWTNSICHLWYPILICLFYHQKIVCTQTMKLLFQLISTWCRIYESVNWVIIVFR